MKQITLPFSPARLYFLPSGPNSLFSTIAFIVRPDLLSSNSPEGHEKNHDIFSRPSWRLGRPQSGLPPDFRPEALQKDILTFDLLRQSCLLLTEDHFKIQQWWCVLGELNFAFYFSFLTALGSRLLFVFIAALTSSCPISLPYTR